MEQKGLRHRKIGRTLAEVEVLDLSRVMPLKLDITNQVDVEAEVLAASDVTLLVNNAGYAASGTAMAADFDDAVASMDTNYFGTLRMIRAFVPDLEQRGGGAIVRILSMLSLASIAGVATYPASKAALESVTQSMRSGRAGRGIDIHALYPAVIGKPQSDGPRSASGESRPMSMRRRRWHRGPRRFLAGIRRR